MGDAHETQKTSKGDTIGKHTQTKGLCTEDNPHYNEHDQDRQLSFFFTFNSLNHVDRSNNNNKHKSMQDKFLYSCTSNIWYPGITSHFLIFTIFTLFMNDPLDRAGRGIWQSAKKKRKIVLEIVWKKAKSYGNFQGCLKFPGISFTVY